VGLVEAAESNRTSVLKTLNLLILRMPELAEFPRLPNQLYGLFPECPQLPNSTFGRPNCEKSILKFGLNVSQNHGTNGKTVVEAVCRALGEANCCWVG
jgi:hypothetical protein